MSYFRLKTPDGYFDDSLEKTMASVKAIRKRRRTVIFAGIVAVLAISTFFSISAIRSDSGWKEYLAQQKELERLDIFLEIN